MKKFNALFEKIIKGATAFKHMVKYTLPDTMSDEQCADLIEFLESNPEIAKVVNELEHTVLTDPQWAAFWRNVQYNAQKQNKLLNFSEQDWKVLQANFINRLWGSRLKDGDELATQQTQHSRDNNTTALQRYDTAIQHIDTKDKRSFMATTMQPKSFRSGDMSRIGSTR